MAEKRTEGEAVPAPASGAAGVIEVELAAKLLMVTPRWIQKLSKEGWIAKPYTIPGVVQGYIKWRDDSDKRRTVTDSASRSQDARTAKIEFELAAQRNEYIRTDLSFGVLQDVLGPLRAGLDGVPAAFTRDKAERKRLEDLIGAQLNAAADRAEKAASELAAGGDNLTKAGAAVARRLGKAQPRICGERGRPRAARA